MIIQHNIWAMNAGRQFNISNNKKAKSSEKLSSGYRINRSADDAAGLAISEKMRRQIRGLNQAANNILDGVGYVQTGEGALNEVDDMLQRMTELAVQASNDTNTVEDRDYIDQEIQQIKSEMSRIFDTTSFNERLIWQPDPDRLIQTGTEKKPTISFFPTAATLNVTDANKGVIPYSAIKLTADDAGITASWKGYDGNQYETSKVDWETLENGGYSFRLDDYMPDSARDGDGNALFSYSIRFSPNSNATQEQIIDAINQSAIGTGAYAYYDARFEDASGNAKSTAVTINNVRSSYSASYAAAVNGSHTFDAADDPFIEPSPSANLTTFPSATTVEEARNSTETWKFTFDMPGIGTVTARCTGGTYVSNSDLAEDDEHYWWQWQGAYVNRDGARVYEPHYTKRLIQRNIGTTLGDVMSTLTGPKGSDRPGLLTSANGGDADTGGSITLSFSATANSNYSAGSVQNQNSVFSFSLNIAVSSGDTEQSVLNKITSTLNANTRLDVSTSSADREYGSVGTPSSAHKIDVPVYGYDAYTKSIMIQAGADAFQGIEIRYQILSLDVLGLADTKTWTYEDSQNAINEIKSAMTIVNEERAVFGAYQNRLEHAYNANKNTEENTQAAESLIRDTDMASEMVTYSTANIVAQFGESMISQANQTPNGVLSLLQ